ncbi:tektin-4-like [Stegastes partitus]|uniref:Tektin n=1 Tax=Stegastes partitus TaxID=144197 RepID=A0A3B5B276_9TELE|nr:PREDICTED: tektin-4-like [Stegastes partitus]
MWQHRAPKEDQLRGARLTLPILTNSRSLVSSSSQLQRSSILKLEDEIICLGEDISRIPSIVHGGMTHLSSRHMEVGRWQALISECINQVKREIRALEQEKDATEGYLQERQLYAQLINNCVVLSNSLSSADRLNPVLTELKKEQQLISEISELLQNQIVVLLNKQSSLKNIRTQLLSDFLDKSEAIKVTTRCIGHQLSSSLPAIQYKPDHASYDQWLSRCRELKQAADDLLKDSSTFRGNLRFTLANLKNTQECQRRSTGASMRKKIHKLHKTQELLIWERHQIGNEISDLTEDVWKVAGQIRNCDSRMHQVTSRLDILNQRPGNERCLDHPHISFTLEKRDLEKMSAELRSVLKNSQQDLALTQHRLKLLESKIAKNAQHLETQQRCQNLHQSFLPPRGSTVILGNRPQLHTAPGCSRPQIQ